MMEALFRKHDRLLANTTMKIIREKMDEIHWNARLVSILGAKGVGKCSDSSINLCIIWQAEN